MSGCASSGRRRRRRSSAKTWLEGRTRGTPGATWGAATMGEATTATATTTRKATTAACSKTTNTHFCSPLFFCQNTLHCSIYRCRNWGQNTGFLIFLTKKTFSTRRLSVWLGDYSCLVQCWHNCSRALHDKSSFVKRWQFGYFQPLVARCACNYGVSHLHVWMGDGVASAVPMHRVMLN